jgi:thymidylate kinase
MSKPTGRFIVMEGADGVGKSTVLKLLLPKLLEAGRYSGARFFHWKPVKGGVHDGGIPETVPHDPRGTTPRNPAASLLYLGYHWLTFWSGYFRYIRPALRRGMLVVADRYTYDILLDPRRFRLNLPDWVLRVFVRTLPHPDAVLALVADPATVRKRKPELSVEEIKAYQKRLEHGIIPKLVLVQAEGTPDQVARIALKEGLGCREE